MNDQKLHGMKTGPFWKTLYFWVLLGIGCGIALGHFAPETGVAMKLFGDAFIKLIKMIVGPVIFCTIVTGIAGMNSVERVGKVGLKTILYFEGMTTIALIIGLISINTFKPGVGMNIDPASLDHSAVADYSQKATEQGGATEFLMNIIPSTIPDAFVKGDILQIVFFSVLFAIGILLAGAPGKMILTLIQELSEILFKMIGLIVKLAPLGAFGAMAFTVGKYGIQSLGPQLNLMLVFYVTCILFVGVALGTVMRLMGLRVFHLIRYIKEELFIVLGTSSSEAALPRLIEKMIALGCSRSVVGMVVPAGYSFNLDGTCIYLTMAAIFIAQALNIPLTLWHEVTLLAVLLLTSKGAAGVTGSGFVVLAATLSSVGHMPVEGLVLILGIDRFMSEARAITNFIGNAVATIVVAKWENEADMEQIHAVLAKR